MGLNDKLLWALTPEAREVIQKLRETTGIDQDLAITLLEALCSEEIIYNLPDSDENNHG